MKKTITVIISVLLAAVIVTCGILSYLNNRIQYNESYVNGNTAGNLYNGGLFCESSGKVFFANPDDYNRLYAMDLNGSNLEKLCNDRIPSVCLV